MKGIKKTTVPPQKYLGRKKPLKGEQSQTHEEVFDRLPR
jgi:hypothetical protein